MKSVTTRRAMLCTIACGVIAICAGCPREYHGEVGVPKNEQKFVHDYDSHYPHNLARVKCRKDTDKKDIEIEVMAAKQVLVQPYDYVVFVCQGEKVFWHSADKDLQIAVTFKNAELSKTLFKSHNTIIKSNSSSSESATATEVVDTLERHAHEYTIVVTKDGQSYSLDPHVIPMGN